MNKSSKIVILSIISFIIMVGIIIWFLVSNNVFAPKYVSVKSYDGEEKGCN